MGLRELVLTPDILDRVRRKLEERALEQKACEERGHPHARVYSKCYFRGNLSITMACSDCGSYYEGKPTTQDYQDLQRMLDTVLD